MSELEGLGQTLHEYRSVLSLPLDADHDDLIVATGRSGGAGHAQQGRNQRSGATPGAFGSGGYGGVKPGEDALYDEAVGPTSARRIRDAQFIFSDPVGDEVAVRVGAVQQAACNIEFHYRASVQYRRDLAKQEREQERAKQERQKAFKAEAARAGALRRAAAKAAKQASRKTVGSYVPKTCANDGREVVVIDGLRYIECVIDGCTETLICPPRGRFPEFCDHHLAQRAIERRRMKASAAAVNAAMQRRYPRPHEQYEDAC